MGGPLPALGRLIGDHEGADARFGVWPEPATGLDLANQFPVIDRMAAKGALAELMNPQECVDVCENASNNDPTRLAVYLIELVAKNRDLQGRVSRPTVTPPNSSIT